MAKNDKDLEKLIKACQRGKASAQEKLYKQFYAYAMSIALRYAYSHEEAAEITNDSFLKAFRHVKEYNIKKSFRAWFRTILVRTAIDYYRRNKQVNETLSVENAPEPSIDDDAYQQLKLEDIMRMLGTLPEMLRLTFNLFEIEGFSHKEIAQKLDISESASRANLSRAKKMLRVAYTKIYNSEYAKVV